MRMWLTEDLKTVVLFKEIGLYYKKQQKITYYIICYNIRYNIYKCNIAYYYLHNINDFFGSIICAIALNNTFNSLYTVICRVNIYLEKTVQKNF